eukprot:COSAG01_NODE_915_length_12761_cov_33.161507_8_plen_92_part_00
MQLYHEVFDELHARIWVGRAARLPFPPVHACMHACIAAVCTRLHAWADLSGRASFAVFMSPCSQLLTESRLYSQFSCLRHGRRCRKTAARC